MGRYLRGRLRLHGIVRAARAPNASLRACCRTIASELGLKRSPRLLVTEELDSPAMIGLLRPVILGPSWMAVEGDGPKLDWSLRHELTHCKWLDPAAILVRDLAAILFYFHPAAWWAANNLMKIGIGSNLMVFIMATVIATLRPELVEGTKGKQSPHKLKIKSTISEN